QARLQRGIRAFHLQPDLRYRGVARSDARGPHALVAQRGEAGLSSLLGAEYTERQRPAQRAFLLHDEVLLDAELLQLCRLAQRGLAVALRRYEHPPAGVLLRAALRQPWAECERFEHLLGAGGVG